MMPARSVLPFMRAITATSLLALLAAPLTSARAQDAGVSGIPPGPANARGLNGSVNDPSGIGNAGRVPPLPQPNLAPVPVPNVPSPIVTHAAGIPLGETVRRKHYVTPRNRRASVRQAARYNGRVDHGVPTICRGC
jgi:hypothetical protein